MRRQGALAGAGASTQRTERELRDTRDSRIASSTGESMRGMRGADPKSFYKDLGFSATPEEAQAYRKNEADYQKSLAERQGSIDEFQGKYDTAAGQLAKANKDLPSLKKAVDKSWGLYKKDLVGVRVMGPGDKVEATYYVPKGAADSMVGQRGVFASSHENGKYMNVMMKNFEGQNKLHDSLRVGANTIEQKFKTQSATAIEKQLNKARGQLQTGASDLGSAKTELETAKTGVTVAERERAEGWKALRDKYKARQESMKNLLGGLSIE